MQKSTKRKTASGGVLEVLDRLGRKEARLPLKNLKIQGLKNRPGGLKHLSVTHLPRSSQPANTPVRVLVAKRPEMYAVKWDCFDASPPSGGGEGVRSARRHETCLEGQGKWGPATEASQSFGFGCKGPGEPLIPTPTVPRSVFPARQVKLVIPTLTCRLNITLAGFLSLKLLTGYYQTFQNNQESTKANCHGHSMVVGVTPPKETCSTPNR